MNHGSSWSHETELAAELVSASNAREFVRLHLGEHDLSYLEDEIRLVVSELATNALRHARTPFTVTLHGGGESVLLIVHDGSSSALVPAAEDGLDEGGRGLSIVDELSHDWGVVQGCGEAKSVWASFETRLELDDPEDV